MEVSQTLEIIGKIAEANPGLLLKLGDIETSWFKDDLSKISIEKPVYISGLARSGTTIILEFLSKHPKTASHRYRDFPLLHIPIWWNWFLDRASSKKVPEVERAHKDGIFITPESPEAMEEIIWMLFFPDCHNSSINNSFDSNTGNLKFETFYKDHIKKILYLLKATRYLSKGNYNIARLEYINKIFPDAKIIVTIRDPEWHIASLIKQHRLFCTEETKDIRVLNYMRRCGHFEFGLDRRPINTGDNSVIEKIESCWKETDEVRGWALYWASIYNYIAGLIENNEKLADQILPVHYNDLCQNPYKTLKNIYQHCELEVEECILIEQSESVKAPSYDPGFTESEKKAIQEETKTVKQKLIDLSYKSRSKISN